VGVTGGHENGYGSSWDSWGWDGDDHEPGPFGNWRRDMVGSNQFETIIFNHDGLVSFQHYENGAVTATSSGQFTVDGESIIVMLNGVQKDGSYAVENDRLTLILDGETTQWRSM
jgi:hypothetical protein